MAMTVRRLVAQEGLGLQLIAGAESADRVIGWAHAIDLPDPTPWLSGGELVMTTGSHLDDDPDVQYRYVRGIARAGCAALAFDTAMRYPEVPGAVRRAAEELGLPLVRVAPETPFIAISRVVVDEITADQVRTVQSVVDAQGRLAREALRGGIPGLVESLARRIGASVCAIGRTGGVLAAGGPRHALLAQKLAARESGARSRRAPGDGAFADDDGHVTIQRLSVAGDRLGRLAALSRRPLDQQARLLLGHAASLIALELAKPLHLRDAEERLRGATARMVLDAGSDVDPALIRYFGVDPDRDVTVVVLTGTGELVPALAQVSDVLHEAESGHLVTERPDRTGDLVVITGADPADADLTDGLPARLQRHLQTRLGRPIGAGISAPAPPAQARAALRQAAAAARVSGNRGHRPVHFAALGAFTLLISAQPNDVLRAAAADVLGPLDEHDRDGRGDLAASLDAYLRSNGQWEPAASALGVHRHTLRNRINRIAEILDVDLESAHARAELWLALRARELLPDT
ncbi:PucR family transcriptional regulator [Tomitella fengzijianii]|nr:PucR family transcriptional regulator [Tomitella fengzijianii]